MRHLIPTLVRVFSILIFINSICLFSGNNIRGFEGYISILENIRFQKEEISIPLTLTLLPAKQLVDKVKKNGLAYKNVKNKTLALPAFPEENSYNIETANFVPNPISNKIYQYSLFEKGIYYGVVFMLILLNFVCFFIFEEKMFLFYSLFLTSLAILFFNGDDLFSVIGLESTVSNTFLKAILILVASATGALFSCKYLMLNKTNNWLQWVCGTLLIMSVAFIGMGIVDKLNSFYNYAVAIAVVVSTIYFIAGIVLFAKKNYVKFYVIATAIPLLFAIDFYLLQPFGINFLNTTNSHIKIAMVFEMFIITYAIMFRMRALRDEQTLLQTEMRIFLKRQQNINNQDISTYLEDVYLENLIMQYDLNGLEIKILQYISEGKDNLKIAHKLNISEERLEEVTQELYSKLEIQDQVKQDYQMVENQPDYIYN